MSNSPSLLSTAQTVLSILCYLLILAVSLAVSLALPVGTFHLGRFLAGYHYDVGHPGLLIVVSAGFVIYSSLCGLGLEDEGALYFLVNVPFGVGVGCALGLGVWMIWVGLVKAVRLVQGGEEKVKDS